eukprot:jgi/Mesvir1/25694/Mv25006-RA.1
MELAVAHSSAWVHTPHCLALRQSASRHAVPSKLSFSKPLVGIVPALLPGDRPRRSLVVSARGGFTGGQNNGYPLGSSRDPDKETSLKEKFLLNYVQTVQPEMMEAFAKHAPKQVVDAMRQTVTNMVGSLPQQFFAVTVVTVVEDLAQLMYSVMMTGYMFRNAQHRYELQTSLGALPAGAAEGVGSGGQLPKKEYAKGAQKRLLSGEVLRWNKTDDTLETVDAHAYVEMLEAEVEALRRDMAALSDKLQQQEQMGLRGRNMFLEYLKAMEPQNLQELTSTAGEDVLAAMNAFVTRLIGQSANMRSEPGNKDKAWSETSATELSRLLTWLMVVGYSLRVMEVRYDLDRFVQLPSDTGSNSSNNGGSNNGGNGGPPGTDMWQLPPGAPGPGNGSGGSWL